MILNLKEGSSDNRIRNCSFLPGHHVSSSCHYGIRGRGSLTWWQQGSRNSLFYDLLCSRASGNRMIGAATPHALISTHTTLGCSVVCLARLGARLCWSRCIFLSRAGSRFLL